MGVCTAPRKHKGDTIWSRRVDLFFVQLMPPGGDGLQYDMYLIGRYLDFDVTYLDINVSAIRRVLIIRCTLMARLAFEKT